MLPLALAGWRPDQILLIGLVNLIYQYWIHTESVDRMGIFEWFLMTPHITGCITAQSSLSRQKLRIID